MKRFVQVEKLGWYSRSETAVGYPYIETVAKELPEISAVLVGQRTQLPQ